MTQENNGYSASSGNDPQNFQPTQPAAPVPPVPPQQPPYGAPNQNYGAGAGNQGYGSYGSAPNATYQTGPQQTYTPPQQTYEAEPVMVHPQHAAKKNSAAKTFLVAFAGALVACILALGVSGAMNAMNSGGTETVASNGSAPSITINPSDDATLAEAVAAKCLPSVVAIDVYAAPQQQGSMDDWFNQYFGFDFGYGDGYGYGYGDENQPQDSDEQKDFDQLQLYSQGSGVVLSEDGYVITNEHVVNGGEGFKVTVEGTTYEADLVGSDPSSDVAVLKLKDASGLTPMELGNSDDLTIGEWVMTIGSPFGLEQSVADGIISATSRSQIMDSSQYGNTGEVTIYPNMIQTDAAINPGNSGGALVNSQGQLIGINTLITSYSGNYSGVGFAIPVNYAVNLANQIIDGQDPTHAQLGVSLSTVDSQTAERYGLAVDKGAYIAAVMPDSGADKAGLQVGDIVTGFNGEPVESASDLMLDVRSQNPGDKVTLTVNSSGTEKEVEVTLGDDAQKKTEEEKAPKTHKQNFMEQYFGDQQHEDNAA